MKESDLEKEFRLYVISRGGLCLKQNANWYKNIPDRLILVPYGRAFFLEWKTPGNTLSPGQKKWAQLAVARGHSVCWADSIEKAVDLYAEHG